MVGEHLTKQKKFRIEELTLEGKLERAERIVSSNPYSPIFQNQFYHPEAEPEIENINDDLADILNDIHILEGEFAALADRYKKLLEDSVKKIDFSRKEIVSAREKIMDLNMICAEGSGFFQVTTLTNSDFEEPVFNEDNIITARVTGSSRVECKVVDVIGNGTEGNEYVFVSNAFAADRGFTGNRENITDGSFTTLYEYQKINADKNEPYVFTDLSFDGSEAYCTITLEASQPISSVRIYSPDNEIVLKEVQVSSNNDEYISVINKDIKFNKREDMYVESHYIYESGVVAFPLSRHIKISLASDGYTGDKIAFLHEHLE